MGSVARSSVGRDSGRKWSCATKTGVNREKVPALAVHELACSLRVWK